MRKVHIFIDDLFIWEGGRKREVKKEMKEKIGEVVETHSSPWGLSAPYTISLDYIDVRTDKDIKEVKRYAEEILGVPVIVREL